MEPVKQKQFSLRRLTLAAVLGAAGGVLMALEVPVPFAPAFVKLDFGELPVLIGGLWMGPGGGLLVALLKQIVHFVLHSFESLGIGALANFTGSAVFLLLVLCGYRRWYMNRGLAVSLTVATLIASLAMIAANYFVFFPAYFYLLGLTAEQAVAAGAAVNSAVDSLASLMLYSLLPLNLLKYGGTSMAAYLLWLRLEKFNPR